MKLVLQKQITDNLVSKIYEVDQGDLRYHKALISELTDSITGKSIYHLQICSLERDRWVPKDQQELTQGEQIETLEQAEKCVVHYLNNTFDDFPVYWTVRYLGDNNPTLVVYGNHVKAVEVAKFCDIYSHGFELQKPHSVQIDLKEATESWASWL